MVTLEVPEALSRYADAGSYDLNGRTIGEVFEQLWDRCPDLKPRVLTHDTVHPYLLVMHGDDRVPHDAVLEHPVADGDRIEIVALAEGG